MLLQCFPRIIPQTRLYVFKLSCHSILLWDGLLLSLQSVLSSPVLHLTARASAFIMRYFFAACGWLMVIIRSQNGSVTIFLAASALCSVTASVME
jgi:hypothetical protein